jgi:ATP-dependent 26S proteasome regulatory subunit
MERGDGTGERSPAVYPVYHVLADYGELRGGTVVTTTSTAPRVVEALGVSVGGRVRALVANVTPTEQACEITGLGEQARVRMLDETTVALAMAEPDEFRARAVTRRTRDGVLHLVLGPYATAAVEA